MGEDERPKTTGQMQSKYYRSTYATPNARNGFVWTLVVSISSDRVSDVL